MNFANSDEEPAEGHPSFAFGMAARQQYAQEQVHLQQLQQQELRATIDRFLDSLDAEQALGLARMLTLFNDNPGYQHVVYGQLSSIIRLVHKICATCGDTKHSTMEHLTAQAPVEPPRPEPDYRWLTGLSPQDQIKRLNVTEDPENPGGFICRGCECKFSTLFDRASQGKDCIICTRTSFYAKETPDEQLVTRDLYFRYRVFDSATVDDGVYCFDCFTEFPTMRHRMEQGVRCPVCAIQPEETDDGPSGII